MFQVYSNGENCAPAMQLQQDQLGLSLDSPSSAYSGTPRSALIQARKDVYAYKQRCSDLEMSLYVKEEALEHRDECMMYTREQLKKSQKECEALKREINELKTGPKPTGSPEARRLQRELSMQGEIQFWRTRYAEICNKYGEKGVSYSSGDVDAVFFS